MVCMDCCGKSDYWFTDSAFWNLVVGGPGAKDDPGGQLCIDCFIERAEAKGFKPPAWQLVAPTDEFITVPRMEME